MNSAAMKPKAKSKSGDQTNNNNNDLTSGGVKGGKKRKSDDAVSKSDSKGSAPSKKARPRLAAAPSSKPSAFLEPRLGWDAIFFFFFLTHVLITILWHSQMILPRRFYPKILRDLTETYSRDWQDPLNFSERTPVWYISIIYCEVFLQLPFHFMAIYVFGTGSHKHPWFRIPSIMYSVHVATTFMPIFAFLTSFESLTPCNQSKGRSHACAMEQTLRLKLIAVYYAPFFLIPLRLLTFSVFRTYATEEAVAAPTKRTVVERAEAAVTPRGTEGGVYSAGLDGNDLDGRSRNRSKKQD